MKRSQSTVHMAKGSHSQDLLGMFPVLDNSAVTDVSSGDGLSTSGATELGGLPGAESTRLDTSEVSHNSNMSKEVSDLLNDIHDLNTKGKRVCLCWIPSHVNIIACRDRILCH